MNVTFIPAKKDGDSFLRISQTSFDELGLGITKTGFVPVQPDKAETLIDMFKQGQLSAEFGEKLPSGLYEVSITRAEELVTNE